MPLVTATPTNNRNGFTLIELMVVIAILGVLTAIVIPVVTRHFGESQEQAYEADLDLIQKLVDEYVIDPSNPKFKGRPQFPIQGASKGSLPFYTGDANASSSVIVTEIGNPLGGTVGGKPVWKDNGDGTRDPAFEDDLNDEDEPSTAVGWQVATVVVEGPGGSSITYYVDSRNFLIEFDLMLKSNNPRGSLRRPPESASELNCIACTGSYIYYVSDDGEVETLPDSFPEPDNTGFQKGVFP